MRYAHRTLRLILQLIVAAEEVVKSRGRALCEHMVETIRSADASKRGDSPMI